MKLNNKIVLKLEKVGLAKETVESLCGWSIIGSMNEKSPTYDDHIKLFTHSIS